VREGSRRFRLAFSGDIGRRDLPLLHDPTLLAEVDFAIMESTYGDRVHAPPEAAYAEFRQVMQRAVAERGKVVIPAFALGRTQEIVYALNRMIRAGDIPPVPVFVDSPLATNVTDVFKQHPELYDAETHAFMDETQGRPFAFSSLTYTRSVEQSKAINHQRGPLVVISASGMCESGRILHHLRNTVEDPRNTVVIVSWQAPNTLGRRLAEHNPEVRIFGESYQLRAQVATINGYSAHAGRDQLLAWARAMRPRVKRIFLVHGDPKALAALQQGLEADRHPGVHAPRLHETVRV